MEKSAARSPSFLLPFPVVVLLVNLFAYTFIHANEAAGQITNPTFPQLFEPSCDIGGCRSDCLNQSACPSGCTPGCFNCGSSCPQGCPTNINCDTSSCDPYCACAAGNASWFTTHTTPGTAQVITISAAPGNKNYCQSVDTGNTCQFSLGAGGITQISFDFAVSKECSQSPQQTEWLAFWLSTSPWNGTSEVDFIESRFGGGTPPSNNAGLNTNFDANGTQVMIFPPGPAHWTGAITATFTLCPDDQVAVNVCNSVNSAVGTTTLSASTNYFFVMDTAGGSQNSDCQIKVYNLAMQGIIVPSTLDGATNCVGMPNSAPNDAPECAFPQCPATSN